MAINFDAYSFFDGESQTAVTQKTWADYWRGVIPDGVVAGIANEMKPYGNSSGMVVKVATGACMVDNHRGVLNSEKSLTIATAHGSLPRIDIVVARVTYGNTDSKIQLDVKTGTPASTPPVPSLTRNSTVYEIKLAEVYVDAGTPTIAAEKVTDCRDIFECGEKAFPFKNTDTGALSKGMIVTLDNSVSGGIKKAQSNDLPIGVVRSANITPGAYGQVDTKPGMISEISCNDRTVTVGDALIVSNTPGVAQPGGSPYFTAGLALESKAAGIVANVRSLLTIFSKVPFQNNWYLVDGVTESDVIAAYQFINVRTESDALKNINEGNAYTLSSNNDTITWNTNTGFYFPGTSGSKLLTNDLLASESGFGVLGSIRAAAFGYRIDTSGTGTYCGGIMLDWKRALMVRGIGTNGTTWYGLNKPAVYHGAQYGRSQSASIAWPNSGAVGGSWKTAPADGEPKVYVDGTGRNQTSHTVYNADADHFTMGGIGQFGISTGTKLPFYMTCCVLYSKELDADQHAQLSEKIIALGGVS